jgi:hypothetical protein
MVVKPAFFDLVPLSSRMQAPTSVEGRPVLAAGNL